MTMLGPQTEGSDLAADAFRNLSVERLASVQPPF